MYVSIDYLHILHSHLPQGRLYCIYTTLFSPKEEFSLSHQGCSSPPVDTCENKAERLWKGSETASSDHEGGCWTWWNALQPTQVQICSSAGLDVNLSRRENQLPSQPLQQWKDNARPVDTVKIIWKSTKPCSLRMPPLMRVHVYWRCIGLPLSPPGHRNTMALGPPYKLYSCFYFNCLQQLQVPSPKL